MSGILGKWREINSLLDEPAAARWDEIKRTFGRNLLTGGAGESDPVTRITGQMSAFTVGLEKIERAVASPTLSGITIERLQKIIEGLRAVPVNVEIKVQPVEKETSDELPVSVGSQVQQPSADEADSSVKKGTKKKGTGI